MCLGHGAQKARHPLSPGMLHSDSDVLAQGSGEGPCGGSVVSWLGGAALPVSAPLEYHVCTGKARQPSGADGSRVCAQSFLPLGTRFSAHSGAHTGRVHVCTCVTYAYMCTDTGMYMYTYVK